MYVGREKGWQRALAQCSVPARSSAARSEHGLSLGEQIVLFVTTFLAGLLNATVGGGGLLQVPVLMLLLPGTPIATILGTAKLAGLPGLAGASVHLARRLEPAWPLVLRASAAAIPFAIVGARIATHMEPAQARLVILVLLAVMSAWVLFQPSFGQQSAGRAARTTGLVPWAIGAGFGLYEGFLGSGSGSVLIVLFVLANRLDLVAASVATTLVTLAGVVAAVGAFVAAGAVLPLLALKMVAFNFAGSMVGARLVMLRENRLLKRMLVAILSVLLVRLSLDLYGELRA